MEGGELHHGQRDDLGARWGLGSTNQLGLIFRDQLEIFFSALETIIQKGNQLEKMEPRPDGDHQLHVSWNETSDVLRVICSGPSLEGDAVTVQVQAGESPTEGVTWFSCSAESLTLGPLPKQDW